MSFLGNRNSTDHTIAIVDGRLSLDGGTPVGSLGVGATNSVGAAKIYGNNGTQSEFSALVGGQLNLNATVDDIAVIFNALTTSGGPDGVVGIQGVQLLEVTETSFRISLTSDQGGTDTVNFTNAGAIIAAAASSIVNVGNRTNDFGIFDTDGKADGFRFFLGSIKQTTDLGDLGLSSYIMTHQVDDVFEALKDGDIAGVDLIGGNEGDTSFTLRLKGSPVKGVDTFDTVLVTGEAAAAAIAGYYAEDTLL